MRGLVFAAGLLALAPSAGAYAQAQGCTAANVASCDATRRESLADKQFAPKSDGMTSYVRKSSRDNEKRERQEVEQKINEAIMAGRCEEARKIASDAGYHAAVSQIRRSCKS